MAVPAKQICVVVPNVCEGVPDEKPDVVTDESPDVLSPRRRLHTERMRPDLAFCVRPASWEGRPRGLHHLDRQMVRCRCYVI